MTKLSIPNAFECAVGGTKLLALLKQELPNAPSIKRGVAAGTRGPTRGDQTLKEADRLEQVVIELNLLKEVVDAVKQWSSNRTVENDPASQSWKAAIDPKTSAYMLPCEIHSECDTSSWIWSTLLRPALFFLEARFANQSADEKSRSMSIHSASGATARPDAMMCYGASSSDVKPVVTIEFKTSNALDGECFSGWEEIDSALREQRTSGRETRIAKAFRFWWPEKNSGLDKDTRILTQIWTQMQSRQTRLAILSSYNTTRFFYRPEKRLGSHGKHLNTLIMSRCYTPKDADALLTVIACLYRGCDSCHVEARSFTVDNSWWGTVVDKSKPTRKNREGNDVPAYGIDPRLLKKQ